MPQTPQDRVLSMRLRRIPTIALSEGDDPRVVSGGVAAARAGVARIILIGEETAVRALLDAHGHTDGIDIHDPATSPHSDTLATVLHQLRGHKGVDADKARQMVRDPLVYAALCVKHGIADGTVGGAVATTSDVVRAALQIIGKAKDAPLVSSFFLMLPPESADRCADTGRTMVYSDCGLVIDPSAAELCAIAAQSARSFEALVGESARIAMLSFSTKGSARHDRVTKVTDALKHLRQDHPGLQADGELQFDAAFVPEVGQKKAPGSEIAGQANVMIFPNLDAGNIAYKITQRLGRYMAIGPILQGLARPANDLSRGCSAEDVTQMIAVTALQSGLDLSPGARPNET